MVPQNLAAALPFWTAKEFQTFRREYAQGKDELSAINCRADRLLPWIIKGEGGAPNYVYLVRRDGTRALDITSLLTILNGTHNSVDYCYHEGSTDLGAGDVPEYSWNGSAWALLGDSTVAAFVSANEYFYLEIDLGSTYYSELLRVSDFPEFSEDPTGCAGPMSRLECVTACGVGDVPPLGTQKLFVAVETSDPEYSLDREVSKNGNEDESALWVKMKKRYRLAFLAVETVADFVATVPLFGTINVTDQTGFQSAAIDVDFKISWPNEHNGALALCELYYSIEYVSQTHCC